MRAISGISGPILAVITVAVLVAVGALILMGFIPIGQQASKNVIIEVVGTPIIYNNGTTNTIAVVTIRNLGSEQITVYKLLIKDANGNEIDLVPVDAQGGTLSGSTVLVDRGAYATIKFSSNVNVTANLDNLVNVAGVIITDHGNVPVSLVVSESW